MSQPGKTSTAVTTPTSVSNAAANQSLPGKGMNVALFATCINDLMYPETPIATVKILERLGCTVHFPKQQTCCGQPFVNTGYFDETVPSIKSYITAFSDYDYIIGPSGSCIGSVRHQHPMVAKHTKDDGLLAAAVEVGNKSYELTEFIVNVLQTIDVGAYFPHKETMHTTCHSMRVTKVGDAPLKLLQAVKGLTYIPLPDADRCCGFGGTFSVKNSDVSVAMGSEKASHIIQTGAQYVVAGDNSCLMHVGGILSRDRASVEPIHIAQVLAST